MSSFPRDDNRVPIIGGVSALNPRLAVPFTASPTTGAIYTHADGSDATNQAILDTLSVLMNAIRQLVISQDSVGRLRMSLDTVTFASTTSIGTVSNVNTFGGTYLTANIPINTMNIAFNEGVMRGITTT